MLRFTDNASPFELQALSFQNILCYGLPCNALICVLSSLIFQNILCYGLPIVDFSVNHNWGLFQNILCYGLPVVSFFITCMHVYFKTSYVTVYLFLFANTNRIFSFQNILCYGLPSIPSRIGLNISNISKHLMLRFTHVCHFLKSVIINISKNLM